MVRKRPIIESLINNELACYCSERKIKRKRCGMIQRGDHRFLHHLENYYVIYYLVGNGRVIYIGKSKNITNRLLSHQSSIKKYTHIYYAIANDEDDATRLEYSGIYRFSPEHNTHGIIDS